MGLASDLKAAVAAVNETDKKLARLVGQHIEDTAAGLLYSFWQDNKR